jgi:hypothetical protein
MEIADPVLTKPRMLQSELNLLLFLTEHMSPNVAKDVTVTLEPAMVLQLAEIWLPRRLRDLIEQLLPNTNAPSELIDAPSLPVPLTDNPDAKRAKALSDTALPSITESNTETVSVKFDSKNTDNFFPTDIDPSADTADPTRAVPSTVSESPSRPDPRDEKSLAIDVTSVTESDDPTLASRAIDIFPPTSMFPATLQYEPNCVDALTERLLPATAASTVENRSPPNTRAFTDRQLPYLANR